MTTLYYQGQRKAIIERPLSLIDGDFGDMPPILKRIFLARGVVSSKQLDRNLNTLPSPWLFSNMEKMVAHLVDAFENQQRLCIVADIDADGATSCAVALRGLRMLGAAQVDFVVPNRFEHAYGLSIDIVELAAQKDAQVLITVDNGISSHEGVLAAKERGMRVLITDHHLPAKTLPDADAIVNPNLVGDEFQLLDYVALGTVADVVSLDSVNRTLVHQGLLRIRNGNVHAGILALIEVAGKNAATLQASDFGFGVAPRLNAAGRIQDMSLGILCLLEDEPATARQMAAHLDLLNSERREIEREMKQEAMNLLNDTYAFDKKHAESGVCLYDENWHQGVIGILAARI
ncbi:MAG: Single-stranded-DNA-specific exonuclease RecJ, partial [Pseudomonadota bacterium]